MHRAAETPPAAELVQRVVVVQLVLPGREIHWEEGLKPDLKWQREARHDLVDDLILRACVRAGGRAGNQGRNEGVWSR